MSARSEEWCAKTYSIFHRRCLFLDNKGNRDKIQLLCSYGYKIACFLSLFEVWCDNELVCLHTHGTRGMAESGTSWMFHGLRANVWMFGTRQEPERFEMYVHKKIGDRLSSYYENITRRAKLEGGYWRGSSSQCDKAQTAWLSIHSVTTITPLMLHQGHVQTDFTLFGKNTASLSISMWQYSWVQVQKTLSQKYKKRKTHLDVEVLHWGGQTVQAHTRGRLFCNMVVVTKVKIAATMISKAVWKNVASWW